MNTQPNPPTAPANPWAMSASSSGVRDWLDLLQRRKWLFLSAFTAGTALTIALLFLTTPLYKGEVRILIEGEKMNLERAGDNASIDNYSVFENYLKTQIELIKSRAISGRVAKEYGLDTDPRYLGRNIRNLWMSKDFEDDVDLQRLSGSRVIALIAYHPDPETAAKIANRLAQVYVEDNSSRRAASYLHDQRVLELSVELDRLQAESARLSAHDGADSASVLALRKKIDAVLLEIRRSELGITDPLKGSVLPESEDKGDSLSAELAGMHRQLISSSARVSNVSIVDEAVPLNKPAKPNKLMVLGLGLLMTYLVSYGLVLLVDRIDDRVRSEDDVQGALGMPVVVLGSLPRSQRKMPGLGKIITADAGSGRAESKTDEMEDQFYAILCTRILWSLPFKEKAQTMVVCGSVPGEGKTTVSTNIAVTLAGLKKRVLLVDADIRRGRQHEIHRLSGSKGLANYLEGSEDLINITHKSSVLGLDVVPVGTITMNSSWLFHSQRMDQFIEEAKEKYDFVLFDAPPLTIVSDASILVQKSGQAIFVVRSGQTPVAALQKAHQILQGSNAGILGFVLNDSSSHEKIGYSKYSKYYAVNK